MDEKKEVSWDDVETLASEIINGMSRESKAKDFAQIISSILLGGIIAGLIITNHAQMKLLYENDSQWRQTVEKTNKEWSDYLSQYDFISQDGEGYNYYNSEIGGDVINGTTDTATEESWQSSRNSNQETKTQKIGGEQSQ